MEPEMRKSAYITGTVGEEQLLRNEYLAAEAGAGRCGECR